MVIRSFSHTGVRIRLRPKYQAISIAGAALMLWGFFTTSDRLFPDRHGAAGLMLMILGIILMLDSNNLELSQRLTELEAKLSTPKEPFVDRAT